MKIPRGPSATTTPAATWRISDRTHIPGSGGAAARFAIQAFRCGAVFTDRPRWSRSRLRPSAVRSECSFLFGRQLRDHPAALYARALDRRDDAHHFTVGNRPIAPQKALLVRFQPDHRLELGAELVDRDRVV